VPLASTNCRKFAGCASSCGHEQEPGILHQGKTLSQRSVLPFEGDSHPAAIASDVSKDIPVLANHFLSKYGQVINTETKQLTIEALNLLMRYHWPGDARQLENAHDRKRAPAKRGKQTKSHPGSGLSREGGLRS
jgi:hypothetical protein